MQCRTGQGAISPCEVIFMPLRFDTWRQPDPDHFDFGFVFFRCLKPQCAPRQDVEAEASAAAAAEAVVRATLPLEVNLVRSTVR